MGGSHERKRSGWVVYGPVLIVAAGACAYLNSLGGDFVFDDGLQIVKNQHIRHLWPPGDLLTHSRRPVVSVTLAINYAIGELDPWGYHAFNAAVHLLAGLTLFGVVRRTLLSRLLAERFGDSSSRIATAIALIWVVHPLQTESVTYIIQRAESLMGLFYLLTLYCVIRAAFSKRRRWWHLAAVAACALGMGSKAVMVTAPVVIAIYDRVFISGSWVSLWRRRKALYVGLALTWGGLVACGVPQDVLNPSTPDSQVGFGFKGITPLSYALTQPGVMAHYLRLSLWPHPLCIDYDWPPARSLGAVVPAALLAAALIGAAVWSLRWAPALGFLGIWFFVILAPTSSFIPIKDLAFEHRMYLPLASVVTVVVLAGRSACIALGRRRPRWPAVPYFASCGLVVGTVVVLAYLTIVRNTCYRSGIAMWRDVIAKNPENARAHNDLACHLIAAGKIAEAVQVLQRGIDVDPYMGEAYANLGSALHTLHEYDEAIHALRRAAGLLPADSRVYTHLGACLDATGKIKEARAAYLQALRIHPQYAEAHHGLGHLYLEHGNAQTAVEAFKLAVRFDPNLVEGYYDLGQALAAVGATDDAVAAYRKALELNPHHLAARQALERMVPPGQEEPP